MTNAAAVDKQKTELRLRMIQATNAGMTETEITKLAEEVYAIHGRGPATDTPANINNPFFHNALFDNVNDNRGGGLFSRGNTNSALYDNVTDNRGGGLLSRGNTNSTLYDNVNDNVNNNHKREMRACGLWNSGSRAG